MAGGGLPADGACPPFVLIDRGELASGDPGEVLSVLGSAMAPARLGLSPLLSLSDFMRELAYRHPLAAAPLAGLRWVVEDWRRKVDLTFDRAGALAAGGVEPVLRRLARAAGGPAGQDRDWGGVSPEALVRQAERAEKDPGSGSFRWLGQWLGMAGGDVCWAVPRSAALSAWAVSEEGRLALAGRWEELAACRARRMATPEAGVSGAGTVAPEDHLALWGVFGDPGAGMTAEQGPASGSGPAAGAGSPGEPGSWKDQAHEWLEHTFRLAAGVARRGMAHGQGFLRGFWSDSDGNPPGGEPAP